MIATARNVDMLTVLGETPFPRIRLYRSRAKTTLSLPRYEGFSASRPRHARSPMRLCTAKLRHPTAPAAPTATAKVRRARSISSARTRARRRAHLRLSSPSPSDTSGVRPLPCRGHFDVADSGFTPGHTAVAAFVSRFYFTSTDTVLIEHVPYVLVFSRRFLTALEFAFR